MGKQTEKFVVGIKTLSEGLVKAFDVCVKGEDVYVNYSDCATPEFHKSYHASGQQHFKMSGAYIKWTGGLTGEMEPMKLSRTPPGAVVGRSDFFTVGWEISKLDQILPALQETSAMTVDAHNLGSALVVCFQVNVIGTGAKPLENVLRFPIVGSQRFGTRTRVEVIAFIMGREDQQDEPALSSTDAGTQ